MNADVPVFTEFVAGPHDGRRAWVHPRDLHFIDEPLRSGEESGIERSEYRWEVRANGSFCLRHLRTYVLDLGALTV